LYIVLGQTINHEGKRRSCDGPMDRTEVNPIGQKLGPALKGPALELPTLHFLIVCTFTE
jgi:hypothetical protein